MQGLGAGSLSPRPRGTRRAGEGRQHGPDNRGCWATAVRLRKAIEAGQACERSAPVRNHGQLARKAASVPGPFPLSRSQRIRPLSRRVVSHRRRGQQRNVATLPPSTPASHSSYRRSGRQVRPCSPTTMGCRPRGYLCRRSPRRPAQGCALQSGVGEFVTAARCSPPEREQNPCPNSHDACGMDRYPSGPRRGFAARGGEAE